METVPPIPTSSDPILEGALRRLEARVAMVEDRVRIGSPLRRLPIPETSPRQRETLIWVVILIVLGMLEQRLGRGGHR